MDVEAAEQLAGHGRSGIGRQQGRAGQRNTSHRRDNASGADWCPQPPDCHAASAAFGASRFQMLSVRLSLMTNSGTISRTMRSAIEAQTGSLRASRKPTAIIRISDSDLITLSRV